MANLIPVRGVGDIGVVTDIRPAALPVSAYTRAKNVRFDQGSVSRGPVFRTIQASLGFTPVFTYGIPAAAGGGFSDVVMVSPTFQIKSYNNGSVASKQGSISTTSSTTARFSGASLADITYLNRNDKKPVYMPSGGSAFADLTHWDSAWRAESLRSYGDFLIALNMTESGTSYNSRVRWSDLTLANSIPGSWDAGDTTKSAGFNDLVEMKTPIVDGLTLGTNFIIYSQDQVWLMEFTGGSFIFNFRKLFSDVGIMNQNCVCEVEGKHFVFGDNDIYMHDTHTRQSIVDEKIKQYVFSGLNSSKTDRCFVQHNPDLEEIYFCYASGDDMAEFTSGGRCNRAAVYNYKNSTWSFMDLPNVNSSTQATVDSTNTYATINTTYASMGGSYFSQESGYATHVLFVGQSASADGISSDKLYGLDLSDTNTSLSFPLDLEGNRAPLIERVGIDLDEMSSVSGYKVVTKVYPQVTTDNANKQFEFTFGASDLQGSDPVYATAVVFDGATDHKIDSRAAGRYLAYKMTMSGTKDFAFIGFDAEVTTTGRR